jgi:membrane-bound lytic murein transglycosylase MltF
MRIDTTRLLVATAVAVWVTAAPAPSRAQDDVRTLPVSVEKWTGDFSGMKERRVIRVLAAYSRTLYYNDRGRDRGMTAELVRDFEQYINKKYRKQLHNRPITVVLVPVTRDRLLSGVAEGYGDIAAANLTVTEERLRLVDFFAPDDLPPGSELVTNRSSDRISSVGALSGKSIHVRPSSSYHESLLALNARFKREGKAPIEIVAVPDALEDEDMMEMVDAGLMDFIVVDDWKAKMWATILPRLTVTGVAVRTGAVHGWAFRKSSPELRAELEDFYRKSVKVSGVIPYRIARDTKRVKRLQDPTGTQSWKRFQETIALFEKYGDRYGFDPLMLVAQGFQESKLDQDARGPTGAVGIMQLMPATGEELKVGDITMTEPNIHAGAKYMNQLMTNYFQDADFDEMNRTLFAFAAYNAGPGRISKLRKVASDRGLDPNVWFDNVEIVVSERVGRETTTYVRNIFKYYVSYKLALDVQSRQEKARGAVEPSD